jgi:hypothetical protein
MELIDVGWFSDQDDIRRPWNVYLITTDGNPLCECELLLLVSLRVLFLLIAKWWLKKYTFTDFSNRSIQFQNKGAIRFSLLEASMTKELNSDDRWSLFYSSALSMGVQVKNGCRYSSIREFCRTAYVSDTIRPLAQDLWYWTIPSWKWREVWRVLKMRFNRDKHMTMSFGGGTGHICDLEQKNQKFQQQYVKRIRHSKSDDSIMQQVLNWI